MTPLEVLLAAAAVLLGAAVVPLLVRLTIGPTILDRSVALDVVMALTIVAVCLVTVATGEVYALPVLLALSTAGFVGAVSIARFASGSDDVDGEDAEREARDETGGGVGA